MQEYRCFTFTIAVIALAWLMHSVSNSFFQAMAKV